MVYCGTETKIENWVRIRIEGETRTEIETGQDRYVIVRPIRAAVPQGSTLSPLLYSAYVNDILRPKTGVQLALFADDIALYLRSNCLRDILPRLQRAIDELTQWLRLWRI
ncbi:Probable RNA-directed DNA polymerase from transposon BS [Eumeta japonica]|uniref:Probable RNA-directed DNA polymerase from transposon BS n=1 Tax=Eumeta variegata TaxID=151549 RepID=A0A4C1SDC4_EUMVA|nr:Probable RNA-directed DNA polymerase from transposon BS [Eumeta japonica]